jgi:hypothetical protein
MKAFSSGKEPWEGSFNLPRRGPPGKARRPPRGTSGKEPWEGSFNLPRRGPPGKARRPPRALWLLFGALVGAGCVPSSKSPVRLNEILPSNGNKGCADEANERNDWIELYNTSNESVDLQGYSLTDDTASWDKSPIPEGVTIEAKSTLLFWADATPDQGKNHLSIKLSSAGEEVVLYDSDGRQVDLVRWGDSSSQVFYEAYADVSFARIPDGTGEWRRCATPTCGSENTCQ